MSDPTPSQTLPYAVPTSVPADPLLRVLGWVNACLGGVAATEQAAGFYGRMAGLIRVNQPGFVPWVLTAAAAVGQLVVGVALIRRASWAVAATAWWAIGSVAVVLVDVTIFAGQMYSLSPNGTARFLLWAMATVLAKAVPIGYSVLCGAVALKAIGGPTDHDGVRPADDEPIEPGSAP